MIQGWTHGFRFAGRALRRSPVFTLVSVLTLGLGVGGTTAIFSLANWALLRPVPGVENPEELLLVIPRPEQDPGGFAALSDPAVRRLDRSGAAVLAVAAWTGFPADVILPGVEQPLRVAGQVVTPGLFPTLGVRPWRGRVFEASEGDPTSVHGVVVVSHGFWRQHLRADVGAVGRTLDVNGTALQVVGVAPPAFHGPDRTDDVSLWAPSSAFPAVMPRVPENILTMEAAPIWANIVARSAPGAPVETVAEQLTAAAPDLQQRGVRLDVVEGFGMHPTLRARLTDSFALLAGLVSLLLALTVANLVNLVLSRMARRQREVVVRKALGASTASLSAALAAEGMVLAVVSSLCALMVGFGIVELLDGATLIDWMPAVQGVPLDGRVLGFTVGTAFVVTAASSLFASAGIQRLAPVEALRSSRGQSARSSRVRRAMVSFQVALSLALVVGAGLLVRSLSLLQSAELGLIPEDLVVFSLNPGVQGYTDPDADRLFRELALDIEAEPGVASAAFTWLAPFGPRRYTERVRPAGTAGDDAELVATANMVTPSFFSTLGIDVVEGRVFDAREYGLAERPARGTVVLNRTLAERLFPDGPAVGRDIVMPGRQETAFEVVGVVEDARLTDPREDAGPMLFDPFGNGYRTTSATFVARVSDDRALVLERLRTLVRQRDPRLPMLEAGPLGEVIRGRLAEDRALARVTSSFALLSLLLASAGLFALVSELVHTRVHEFGIRRVLGAGALRLASAVLRQSLQIVAVGALLGLALAYLVGRLLESRLAGVGSTDLPTFAAATAALIVAATLASLVPALRSARVDPVDALSVE